MCQQMDQEQNIRLGTLSTAEPKGLVCFFPKLII